VAEMRGRSAVADRIGRRDEGERGHDHFIAVLDAYQNKASVQCRGPIDGRYGVRHVTMLPEALLEVVDEFTGRGDPTSVQCLLDIVPFMAGKARLVQVDRAVDLTDHGFNCMNRALGIERVGSMWCGGLSVRYGR